MSHRQILYHLVFSTKHRKPTITEAHCTELYKYTWGIIQNKKCKLHRINGVEDHIHILTHLPSNLALSVLVRDVKTATSAWIKGSEIFPGFTGWQDGYGGFTCSYKEKDGLIGYIKNQEEHHKIVSFEDEYRALLVENGIDFNEKYLF